MRRKLVHSVLLMFGLSLLVAPPAAAAAPDTKIKSGPAKVVNSGSAKFKFSSKTSGATFECKLDGGGWVRCSSPAKFNGIGAGKHKFQVRARSGGLTDPSPAKAKWTIDLTPPDTTITGGPTALTGDPTPTFTFGSSEPATFSCRMDSGSFTACTSPFTLPALSEASHTFQVQARDQAGNEDASPASRTFEYNAPITEDLATAQAAALRYFPNSVLMDVPADCAGSPSTYDCPGGVPDPPANQVSSASTRSVAAGAAHVYNVTVTSTVTTPIDVKWHVSGFTCGIDFNSNSSGQATWTVSMPLTFVDVGGALRIEPGNPDITGIDNGDVFTNGTSPCGSGLMATPGTVEPLHVSALNAYFVSVGKPLCAAGGPDYLGPCPP